MLTVIIVNAHHRDYHNVHLEDINATLSMLTKDDYNNIIT